MKSGTLCLILLAAIALTVVPMQYGGGGGGATGGGGGTQTSPGFEVASLAVAWLAPAFWWRAKRNL